MKISINPKFKIGQKVRILSYQRILRNDEYYLKDLLVGYIESFSIVTSESCIIGGLVNNNTELSMPQDMISTCSYISYKVNSNLGLYPHGNVYAKYDFPETELVYTTEDENEGSSANQINPVMKEIIDKTMDGILSTKVAEFIDNRIKSIECSLEDSFRFFMKRTAEIYAEKVFSNYEERVKSLFEEVFENDEKYNDGFLSIRNGIQSGLRTAAEKYIVDNYDEVKDLVKPAVVETATKLLRSDFSSMIRDKFNTKVIIEEILAELNKN